MFKRGYKYTREEIGRIVFPETGRPAGGSRDTGYVRVGNDLIIFMNIGVATKKAHDAHHKIMLIDGEKLVDLMHQFNVGVQVRSVYEVKEVDEDFFE